ncbi:MAG: endonuclease/exonuclease/phosphatase family protein [Tannerella sp.]|jgi:endonuclease/exonuclease/phosphatase family metal-dependent hydrolase|nr:endonuclease/exonuclease/phosphatase family protein [Tannerella sp.]
MKRKVLSLIAFCLAVFALNAQEFTVGSYNIRYDNTGDRAKGNGWTRRCPLLTQQILFNGFDIFGAQEALHNQVEDLVAGLPGYDYIGVGRDDGLTKGEYVPVFYKKDRFRLEKSGTFWLSEDTGRPNKGWDAALPRICTWGLFTDIKTDKTVWFFNVHFDHIGVEARKQSARLILEKIREMCGRSAVVLTGDFNVDQTNESYRILAGSDFLYDTYEKATVRFALNGTFNNFDYSVATSSRIDHIFVTAGFKVARYGILTDCYRTPRGDSATGFPDGAFSTQADVRTISDHYPVKVELSVEN